MRRMSYAKRLLKAMEHGGLNQKQLAEKVGVSQQAVSKLVARDASGSRYTAQIAATLGVAPEWLATGKGPMEAQEESGAR